MRRPDYTPTPRAGIMLWRCSTDVTWFNGHHFNVARLRWLFVFVILLKRMDMYPYFYCTERNTRDAGQMIRHWIVLLLLLYSVLYCSNCTL